MKATLVILTLALTSALVQAASVPYADVLLEDDDTLNDVSTERLHELLADVQGRVDTTDKSEAAILDAVVRAAHGSADLEEAELESSTSDESARLTQLLSTLATQAAKTGDAAGARALAVASARQALSDEAASVVLVQASDATASTHQLGGIMKQLSSLSAKGGDDGTAAELATIVATLGSATNDVETGDLESHQLGNIMKQLSSLSAKGGDDGTAAELATIVATLGSATNDVETGDGESHQLGSIMKQLSSLSAKGGDDGTAAELATLVASIGAVDADHSAADIEADDAADTTDAAATAPLARFSAANAARLRKELFRMHAVVAHQLLHGRHSVAHFAQRVHQAQAALLHARRAAAASIAAHRHRYMRAKIMLMHALARAHKRAPAMLLLLRLIGMAQHLLARMYPPAPVPAPPTRTNMWRFVAFSHKLRAQRHARMMAALRALRATSLRAARRERKAFSASAELRASRLAQHRLKVAMHRLAHIRRRIAHLSAKANTRSGHAPRSGDAVERAFAPDLSGHGVRPPPTQRPAGALRRIMVKAAATTAGKAATKSVYKLERAKIAKARAATRPAKKASKKKQAKKASEKKQTQKASKKKQAKKASEDDDLSDLETDSEESDTASAKSQIGSVVKQLTELSAKGGDDGTAAELAAIAASLGAEADEDAQDTNDLLRVD